MTSHPHRWHPVACSSELRAGDNIVAGFAAGVELALWRSAEGAAQAWENRCPHRSVRLTLGQIVQDRVACAYHGWQFASGSGQCAAIPAHPAMAAPRNVCVKTFGCIEAGGMVWACLDAPEAPPPALQAVPAGWSFCRSLAIRRPAEHVALALERDGWQPDAAAWSGPLGGVATLGYLLDAQPDLAFLHLWGEAAPGSAPMARMHAAARRLRGDCESGIHLETRRP